MTHQASQRSTNTIRWYLEAKQRRLFRKLLVQDSDYETHIYKHVQVCVICDRKVQTMVGGPHPNISPLRDHKLAMTLRFLIGREATIRHPSCTVSPGNCEFIGCDQDRFYEAHYVFPTEF